MSDPLFFVYVLINSLNKEVFYIGKGKGYRAEMHIPAALRGGSYYVHRKIRKILAKGGKVEIRRVLETPKEQEALEEEIRLIAHYGFENLTNMTKGGEGSSGFRHSEASIEKMRQNQLGKKLSVESIAKREATRKERGIPAWNKGMKMSKEFCEKVRRGGLGKEPWNKGKRMSLSFRKAVSRGQIGRPPMSDKHKRIFTEIAKRPKSEEHKANLSIAKSTPVLCVETGQIFKNALEAAKHFGVSHTAIGQAIKNNGTSRKNHWARLKKNTNFKSPQLELFGG